MKNKYNVIFTKVKYNIIFVGLLITKKSRSIKNSTETFLATQQYLFAYSEVDTAVNFLML